MPSNSSVKTFRCDDKVLRGPMFQPIVLVTDFQLHQNYEVDFELKVEASDQSADENEDTKEPLSISSWELHLSPDEFENSEQDGGVVKEEPCSETLSLLQCEERTFENRQDTSLREPSQDMFLDSPNQTPQPTEHEEVKNLLRSQRVSVDQNRERTEEWDSQELTNVSQRIRVRRNQVKRMFIEVIRKRQMADETLDAVKRRLKKL